MDVFKRLLKLLKKKIKNSDNLDYVKILAYLLPIAGLLFYVSELSSRFYSESNIGLREKLKRSSDIPLPAVTICSPLVLHSNLANLKQFYLTVIKNHSLTVNLSESEQNFLRVKTELCTKLLNDKIDEFTQNRTEDDLLKLLNVGAPTINETFLVCYETYVQNACKNLLRRVLTDLGMCYTFNMQSFETIFNEKVISSDFDSYKTKSGDENVQWTLEGGYVSPTFENKVPYRAKPGRSFQLFFYLNKTDMGDLCYLLKNSFKIIFHLPNEIPTFFHDADFIPFNTEAVLKFSATAYSSNYQLKKFPINQRRCFFEGEKKLKFFKTYTKAHCNFECLANFTLRRCGCVSYSHPRTQETRVCKINETKCYVKAHVDWPNEDEESHNFEMPCNCYPPCFDIHYKIKQKQNVELTAKSSIAIARLSSTNNLNASFSGLNFDFFDFQVRENENFSSYTLENFIADCGGLLGLFLGFSMIGAIDFWHKVIKSARAKTGHFKKVHDTPRKQTHPIIYVIPNSEKLESRRKLIAGRKPKYSKQNFFLL